MWEAWTSSVVMCRGVGGLVVEQRVGQIRYAREEARAVVETGIVEESLVRVGGPPKAGLKRYVGIVVNKEAGAT